jgi:hypothetical protein
VPDVVALIERQAGSVVELYLASIALGQPVMLEQKRLTDSVIAADYDGRTVVELLQNGHDAHQPGPRDGRMELFLDETEGEHGVLYAANGGRPVSEVDFASMCRIALSSKRPDEGIGNKGVGFKSVVQLADCPEVYSASREGTGRFDGFRFRFAQPADFDVLAARSSAFRPGLADELRENVHRLRVTIPLADTPDEVAEFAARGYSTVIRLRLRSTAARESVRRQLGELTDDQVPFHLFLTRLTATTIRIRGAEGEDLRTLTRSARGTGRTATVSAEHVSLDFQGEYLMLRRVVAEADMQAAIKTSLANNTVGANWAQWEGDAEVSVAVPLGEPIEQGRVYAFLPLGENAVWPLAALVNGPFSPALDRRSVHESVPVNDFLFDEVSALCADALIASHSGDLDIPDDVRIDLACWSRQWLPRLISAMEDRGAQLGDFPLVPALTGGDRLSLASGLLWRGKGKVFTPVAVAKAGETRLTRTDVDSHRVRRLDELARACATRIVPTTPQIADFAETLAADLLAGNATPEVWADFYDDLVTEVKETSVLRGRKVVLTDDGVLHAVGSLEPTIYFGRARGEEGGLPPLPLAVRDRLAFMPGDIPWNDARRRQRQGRVWLQSEVREYRTDAVVELLGKIIRDTEDSTTRSACLQYAFELWHDTPDDRRHLFGQAALRVNTRAGWLLPSETHFGTGWGGVNSDIDRRLADLLKAAESVSATLALIGERRVVDTVVSERKDDVRMFYEALGVNHGLTPLRIPAKQLRLRGSQLKRPESLPQLAIPLDHRTQERWRESAVMRTGSPTYATTPYQPENGVAFLPGQEDWCSFSDDARKHYAHLVLHGLDVWPESALTTTFRAPSDPTKVVWPSFVSAFLASADWVPQTTPGERAKQFHAALDSAWWVADSAAPEYLSAEPPAYRSRLTPLVRLRLTRLGARFWSEPGTAADRLMEIAAVVDRQGPRVTGVRAAYEQAWGDLRTIGGEPPHRVVVSSRGALRVVDLDKEGPAVYVQGRSRTAKETLLTQTPVAILAVRLHPVLQMLEDRGFTRVRSCEAAAVTVVADGRDPCAEPGLPLADLGGEWLPVLIDAVAEQRRDSGPVGGGGGSATDPLHGDVRVVLADTIRVMVDGYLVDQEFAPRSMRVQSQEGTHVVVVLRGTGGRWEVLQSASAALADLRGGPAIADSLRLALIDLATRCEDRTPTWEDVAAVLQTTTAELQALIGDRTPSPFDVLPVLKVLACLDLDIAEKLHDARADLASRDEVRGWLVTHEVDADHVLDLASSDDMLETIRRLGITLEHANTSMRALALPLLHNITGHKQQFDAFLQRHRSLIRDRLRDRFVAVFLRGESLEQYVDLWSLPGLGADPAWLDTHWNLPDEVLRTHAEAWTDAFGESPERETQLPPVDELRDRGRHAVMKPLVRARLVIEAWSSSVEEGRGRRLDDLPAVVDQMVQSGHLDFQSPRTDTVLKWLKAHGYWPAAMPLSTASRQLHLDDDDLEAARLRLGSKQASAKRDGQTISYGGHTYSAEPESLGDFVAALRTRIPAAALTIDPTTVAIGAPSQTAAPGRAAGGRSGGSWRVPSLPAEKAKLIGLAGEIVVGEWLRTTLGLPPEDTWFSGYRTEHLADGRGSDTHGYDFRVTTATRTLFYEVKSTTDTSPQFVLGESEVRRANSLKPGEEYFIVHVTDVLDPDKTRLRLLPNPLGPGGLSAYEVVGRSIRFRFIPED